LYNYINFRSFVLHCFIKHYFILQFQGVWHEIEAYPKNEQQGNCINHAYSTGVGNTLSLQSSQITDQSLGLSNGILSFNSTDNSARMTITLPDLGLCHQLFYYCYQFVLACFLCVLIHKRLCLSSRDVNRLTTVMIIMEFSSKSTE
jgi:hypothetical protein